jgi:hypothetical protein
MITLLKLLLICSPVLVAWLNAYVWISINGPGGQEALGLIALLMFFFGIPFVAITGIIVSFLSRNRTDAQKVSVIGYLIPAATTWLYIVLPTIFRS